MLCIQCFLLQQEMEQPFLSNMHSPSGQGMGMAGDEQMPSLMDALKSIPELVERAVQELPQFRKLAKPTSVSSEPFSSQPFDSQPLGSQPLTIASPSSLQPVLFSWDRLSLYVVLAMLILLVIYVLKYTAGVALPTECVAYLLSLLLRALIVLACHNSLVASLQGNAFFGLVKQMDDSRNPKTGTYRKSNFQLVRKLLKELGSQKSAFNSYLGRQVIIFVTLFSSILANFLIFAGCSEAIDQSCLADDGCFLQSSSYTLVELIRSLDNCLLFSSLVLSVCGLGWCFVGHKKQLGYVAAARFSFASHLPASSYVYPIPPVLVPSLPPGLKSCMVFVVRKLSEAFFYSPKIQNDLDFFLLVLDYSNPSKADTVRELLVEHELQKLFNQDFEIVKKMLLSQEQGFVDKEIEGSFVHNAWLSNAFNYYA